MSAARQSRAPAPLPAGVFALPTYGQPKIACVRERGRRRSPLAANADLATVDALEQALHDARAARVTGAVMLLKHGHRPDAEFCLAGAFALDLRSSLDGAEWLVERIGGLLAIGGAA